MSQHEEAPRRQLLDADAIKVILESEFHKSRRVVVISAYVTFPAIEWLVNNFSSAVDAHLVARLSPRDFISKSSDLRALELAIKSGFKLGMLGNLHAKVYLLDDRRIFVGSANFTTNGLNLYGDGNLEVCVEAPCTIENLVFINKIISSASAIDRDTLVRMTEYLAINASQLTECGTNLVVWPDSIISSSLGVWVYDFPWVNLNKRESLDIDKDHDKQVFMLDGSGNGFLRSKSFHWLVDILNDSPFQEMYFGTITQKLHNALSDDPRPYRKDVKMLLNNLLSYCNVYAKEYISIDIPGRHSERVRLIKSV